MKCQCFDQQCPVRHFHQCKNTGEMMLFRTDIEDEFGTLFCSECADDAMESGLYEIVDEDD